MAETAGPDAAALRRFGLTGGSIVALLFGAVLPWLLSHRVPWWPWLVGGVLMAMAFGAPRGLAPVYRGWMRFGAIAGAVNSHVILAVFFYGILMPSGLVMRVLGNDPLRRRRDSSVSYRLASRRRPPRDMEKPF